MSVPVRRSDEIDVPDLRVKVLDIETAALGGRFDPTGFRQARPLQRTVFYTEPYLTCSYCNSIYFLDVVQIRYVDALLRAQDRQMGKKSRRKSMLPLPSSDDAATIASATTATTATTPSTPASIVIPPNECLLPCSGCKRSDGYVAGAIDFTERLERKQQDDQEQAQKEHACATVIARYFRKYMWKCYQLAKFIAQTVRFQLTNKASTSIQSIVRGRLARRRYMTEKHLLAIKASHPLLLRYSLRSVPGKPRLFWYKRQSELDLLYRDYVMLIEKTGHQPPRVVVERNIEELSRRILERKNTLIVLVQKRWRGFTGRRIVRYFRTELHRMFGISVAKAIKIQAVFRGHFVRLNLRRVIAERKRNDKLIQYLRTSNNGMLQVQRREAKERALVAYKKERAQEKTARYMAALPYVSEISDVNEAATQSVAEQLKIGKMQEFHESSYGDDTGLERNFAAVESDQRIMGIHRKDIYRDFDRRQFLLARISERGPLGYGLRSGDADGMVEGDGKDDGRDDGGGDRSVHQKVSETPVARLCSRSKVMRLYFLQELEQIANRTIDRTGRGLKPAEVIARRRVPFHTKPNADVVQTKYGPMKTEPLKLLPPPPGSVGNFVDHSSRMLKDFRKYNEDRLQGLIVTASPQQSSQQQQQQQHASDQPRRSAVKKPVRRISVLKSKGFAYPPDIGFRGIQWLFSDDEETGMATLT